MFFLVEEPFFDGLVSSEPEDQTTDLPGSDKNKTNEVVLLFSCVVPFSHLDDSECYA